MKSIIVFAGSNSKTSINKQLATYTASFLNDVEVKVLDLNDFNLPMYGIDYENDHGIPDNANTFLMKTFVDAEKVASLFYSSLIFIKALIRAIVIVIGCHFILKGRISFGDFFLFFS